MAAKISASWSKYLSWLKKHVPDARDGLASPARYWQFKVSDPENPKGAYGGNVLTLEKPQYGTQKRDGLDQEYVKLCQVSKDAGILLKQIEVRYTRQGDNWNLETAIETGSNYEKVEKARRPLDLKLTAMLHDYGNKNAPNWNTLSFSFEKEAFDLFIMVVPKNGATTRKTLPAPEEFQQVFAEVRALYERFGRTVHGGIWRADPKKIGKPNVMVNAG